MSKIKKYGNLQFENKEGDITYKIFKNKDFLYTILVQKGDITKIKNHQGVNAVFGHDSIDIQVVNNILDEMIEELK